MEAALLREGRPLGRMYKLEKPLVLNGGDVVMAAEIGMVRTKNRRREMGSWWLFTV